MRCEVVRNVCVFCGSSLGTRPIYAQVAQQLGAALADAGVGIVYGGARVGLMGVVADSARQKGGQVVGILPDFLADKEIRHEGLTELLIVGSMHQRKAIMAERADAFVALPGGFGTFEEIFEMLTWTQLGVHGKPCGLLNVEGYFDSFRAQLDRAMLDGFLRKEHREMVIVENTVEPLLARLRSWQAPWTPKWVSRSLT